MSRRLPVYILVDVSESTAGEVTESIDAGLNFIITSLRGNPLAVETAAVSLITFSSVARQVVPLTDLLAFKRPRLVLGSGTALGAAIELWQNAMKREVVVSKPGAPRRSDYRPLAFLLTDGIPTDDIRVGIKAMQDPTAIKSQLIALACGNNVDLTVLFSLTEHVLHMTDPSPQAFQGFFKWVSQSIDATSRSIRSPAAESYTLPEVDPRYFKKAEKTTAVSIDPDEYKFLLVVCSKVRQRYLLRFKKQIQRGWFSSSIAYEPIAAHKVEAFEQEGTGNTTIPNPTGSLPPCPYCENSGIGICACGAAHCKDPCASYSTCPSCGLAGEYESGVDSLHGGQG